MKDFIHIASSAVMLFSYTALSLHIDSRNTIPVTNAAAATVDPRGLPPICTKTITVHPPLKTDCDIYKSTSTATVLTDCSDGCGLRSVKGDGEWRKNHLFNGMRCTESQELDEATTITVQSCKATSINPNPSTDEEKKLKSDNNSESSEAERQFRQLPPPFPPKHHVMTESEMWQSINVAIRICCGARSVASHLCTRNCVRAEAKSSRGDHCRFKCQWKGDKSENCVNTCIGIFDNMFYPNSSKKGTFGQ